jgi:hypothetical protein
MGQKINPYGFRLEESLVQPEGIPSLPHRGLEDP